MPKHERPWNPQGWEQHDDQVTRRGMDARSDRDLTPIGRRETRPQNEYAALMECPPGAEPEESLDEQQALGDLLVSVIEDTLDEEERWVFDAIHYRKLTVRELARELSVPKSTIHRMRHRINGKLQEALLQYPQIQRRLD